MKETFWSLFPVAVAVPGYVIGAALTESTGGGIVSAILTFFVGCWIAHKEYREEDV